MTGHDTFESASRKLFGRAPTPEEILISVNQSVTSHHQSGGITAHTVNLGKPNRSLASLEGVALKLQILTKLSRNGPWSVAGIIGDMESCQYANEIRNFMDENGFEIHKSQLLSLIPSAPIIGIEVWPPDAESTTSRDDHWTLIVGAKS